MRKAFRNLLNPRVLTLLCVVGSAQAMGPQAHAQETYGGFVFSISQTESGAPRMEFGPTVRYDRDRLGASGSLQFELNERGQLQRVTLAPEVSVNAEFADVTYGPRLNLRPGSAQPVALMRSDDVLPRVEGVGFNDVVEAVRTVSNGPAARPSGISEEEWEHLMTFVNRRWTPSVLGENLETAPLEVSRLARVSLRTGQLEKLELRLPLFDAAQGSVEPQSSEPSRAQSPRAGTSADSAR